MPDEFPDDDAIARLLAEALGTDPLPAGLVDRAAELVAMADLDAELAALADDAADEPVGVRGDVGTGEVLLFSSPDGSTAIEVTVGDGRIDGQLLGPDGATPEVVVLRPDGRRHVADVDALGRFAVDGLDPGPARVLVGRSPSLVATDWFVI